MIEAITLAVIYIVCCYKTKGNKFNKVEIGSKAFIHDAYKIDDN